MKFNKFTPNVRRAGIRFFQSNIKTTRPSQPERYLIASNDESHINKIIESGRIPVGAEVTTCDDGEFARYLSHVGNRFFPHALVFTTSQESSLHEVDGLHNLYIAEKNISVLPKLSSLFGGESVTTFSDSEAISLVLSSSC